MRKKVSTEQMYSGMSIVNKVTYKVTQVIVRLLQTSSINCKINYLNEISCSERNGTDRIWKTGHE